MRKISAILTIFLFWSASVSAQRATGSDQVHVIPCESFNITRPLYELVREHPVLENMTYKEEESEDRKQRIAQTFKYTGADGEKYGNDVSIMQKEAGKQTGAQTRASWAGQFASGFRPFDPSGAAGPNHYVQMINSTTFRVYNKTGTVLLTATLGNLWSPATGNNGDPIVLYDKAADRWFLAQFGTSSDRRIYIAISTTNDPTGSYYTYTYTSPAFPDYLKFSVWHDGYYMTSNQAQRVFAFERSAMLAGNSGARSIFINYSPPQTTGFFCPLPGDASDGVLPSAGTPCPIFSYSDNGWGGSFVDAIQVYNMSVNWAATPTGSITLGGTVPTSAFDASYNAQWNDCPQPGSSQLLDGIGGVLMYRAQWKTWSGYNSVVLNWAVRISASQRSIMWAELRQSQSTGTWSVYQQGIYTPDAATRWMGSIAMDNNGGIGLCYLKSNSTSIFPSLCYTGRRSCDPLGTMPITETVVANGVIAQSGTNRVGDYAHTSLDPDGVTFWHTGEYMGGTSSSNAARTHIFSFTIPSCSNDAAVSIAVTSGSNPSCTGASVTFTATPVNGGTTPSYQWRVNGANVGTNSPTYTTSSLTTGQVVTCVMTSNQPGVGNNPATSNAITMTVNAPVTPAVSISTSNTTICSGQSVTFTATPTNGGSAPAFQWRVNGVNAGTNSSTFTTSGLNNGDVVSCVLTSSNTCVTTTTATSNNITMTVNGASATTLSISASSSNICSGQSVTFTANASNPGSNPVYQWFVNGSAVGTNSTTYSSSSLTNGANVSCVLTSTAACPVFATLGTGTGTNSTTSGSGAAYPTYYGSGRQQYLIRASELTALGLSAGNITSLGFNVAGTTGNPLTLNGYTIKIAATTATALTTTFQSSGLTTVFGPVNYTPTLNAINTHNFTTPFVWNGTSNIIVDICFSNQVVGVTAYQTRQTTSSFVSSTFYQADGAAGAGACTQATGTTVSVRPNMTIADQLTSSVSSNTITMSVGTSVTPAVSISINSGGNPSCQGSAISFVANASNGGSSPSFQWRINGNNAGTNSNSFTSSSLNNGDVVSCVLTSNSNCASSSTATSNNITITRWSLPVVSAANVSGCSGTPISLSGSPSGGSFSIANPYTGTSSTTYTYTFTDANGCSASSAPASVTVNPLPTVFNVNGGGNYCSTTSGAAVGLSGSQSGVNYTLFRNGSVNVATLSGTGSALNFGNQTSGTYTVIATGTNACTASMNGSVTVTMSTASTWYQDSDGDTYGNPSVSLLSCSQPAGYVSNNTDCNDSNPAVNPGATEICNNTIDDDCDGQTDEGCATFTWYQDADGDGFGNPNSSISNGSSTPPVGYVANNSDCNDANAAINPNATEICNGIDDNCNNQTDEGIAALTAPTSISGPAGACRGQNGVVFSVAPVAGATSYNWTLPTGATGSSNTNSITVNFGTTFVTGNICVTASNGCSTTPSLCRSITYFSARPSTPASITGPIANVCTGTNYTYSIAAVTNATNYTWAVPAGCTLVSGQGTTSIQMAVPSGFTSGTITVNASNCAGTSTNRSLTVRGIPGIPATPSGTLVGACAGSTQTYSIAAVAGANSYTWTVPAGVTLNSGQGTTSINVTIPTGFISGNISVVANSACGSSPVRTTTIRSVPAQPGNINGPANNLCGGGSYTYSIPAVSGATSYNWTVPASWTITANTGTSITCSVPASGFTSGSVAVIATNACGTGTARSLGVSVLPATPAAITGSTSVCANQSGISYSTAATAGLSYTWTVPSGASIVSGQGTASIVVNWGTANGSVVVRANNACGSSGNRTLAVTVVACRMGEFDNPFQTETSENPEPVFNAYPNPTSNLLNVVFSAEEGQAYQLVITDIAGKVVFEQNGTTVQTETKLEIMPGEWSTGMYFLNLRTGSDEMRSMKVLKN